MTSVGTTNPAWGFITNPNITSNTIGLSKINSTIVTDDYKILQTDNAGNKTWDKLSDNLITNNTINVTKLANSTAHYVVKTNSAGNAVEQGLLVKENCNSSFINQNLTTTSEV